MEADHTRPGTARPDPARPGPTPPETDLFDRHGLDAERLLDTLGEVPPCTIAGLELMIALWAMKRRRLRKADLGRGIRPAMEIMGGMLPIGREGDAIFDIAPLIAELQTGPLLDRVLTEARETADLAL